MSDKIRVQPLDRKAVLYVRQSSAYQVSHNLESQKLQYAMQDRLHQVGWNDIEVSDEDLGRSAAGTQTRTGFVIAGNLGMSGLRSFPMLTTGTFSGTNSSGSSARSTATCVWPDTLAPQRPARPYWRDCCAVGAAQAS